MRFFLLLCGMVCFVSACEKAGKDEIYNENNTSVAGGIVYNIDEKPINGLYKIYYPDGNIKMEMQSKDGKPDGIGKFYTEDGKLSFQGNYSQGVQNGVFYQYYPNGQVHNELNYVNGIKAGEQKMYDEDGNLSAVIVFTDGDPVSGYTIIKDEQKVFSAEELAEIKKDL